MAKRIRDVMTTDPQTIDAGETLVAAGKAMKDRDVGALVVSADGLAVAGIVSERDITRGLHTDPGLLDAPVSQIMTTDVHTCVVQDSIDDLMVLMTERRVRHVPVVTDDGVLAGIVSIGDVVKGRIGQLEFEKQQLEGYISSAG
jgi:CBS domain-containing protein